ncbi:hypothetical protein A1O3_03490 [Capronia epimyces CBS 606.96]|uniref:Heterokaryon incompatibility domain-containing protein n=1 Tax=Capronia epimyces CBS 606.96 TaxID=1182542 RepID=W9Y222_9EURO|nr:uncharacterized protein A1O3_03490 [Capronia epimyces CBS 606.96]EXJ86538.1 hypothetical protein A1O3_03490 [Capronia epimyces CBS 606.96]
MQPRANLPEDSFSDACFNTINAWIKECSLGHRLCTIDKRPPFLPTRLVDVSPESCPSGMRLVHTVDFLDRAAKYAALSHAWGLKEQRIKPIPKTRADSLLDRLDQIPWEELTKTFQDAIVVARRLGLRYIWIDALCIIQDDAADFATQASQMAQIYGRAHVVISATRAATGDVGIFHRRPGAQTVSCTDKEDKRLTAFVKQRLVHDDFITGEPRDFGTSPLFARAWCFQERLLATRVVHFSQHEIVWECNQELWCECGGIRPDSTTETGSNFKGRQALAMRKSSLSVRHRTWYDILRVYTARSLTVESDRLPALSGFAHQIATPAMGRYCAGVWEEDLPASLLWRPLRALPEKQGRVERPDTCSAPTWAWPSVQAVIESYVRYIKDKNSEVVAQVLEVKCQPATADPFGQVAGGHIILDAPAVTAMLRRDEAQTSDERQYMLTDVNDQHDCLPFPADVSLAAKCPDHVPLGSQVLCLIIERFHNHVNANRAACLVLRQGQGQAGDLQVGIWYRIGTVNCPAHWVNKGQRRVVKIL